MAFQVIDTHTHLQWEKFNDDRDAVIERALEAGVGQVITLATDLKTSHDVIALAEKYPPVFAAIGIHPTDAKHAKKTDLDEIKQLAQHPKVVAIGETGMDFYWETESTQIQEAFFLAQLEMSYELDLPIVIHNRDSGQAILDILQKVPELPLKGVFHCFVENEAYADTVLERGFHISFTGNLTYKKANLGGIAKHIPLNRLLLETDSPFLPPVPHRGKRNEPAFVTFIAQKHAELRDVPVDEINKQTTQNASALFRLPSPE